MTNIYDLLFKKKKPSGNIYRGDNRKCRIKCRLESVRKGKQ